MSVTKQKCEKIRLYNIFFFFTNLDVISFSHVVAQRRKVGAVCFYLPGSSVQQILKFKYSYMQRHLKSQKCLK